MVRCRSPDGGVRSRISLSAILLVARYDYFISHHQADTGAEASLLAETLRNQGYRVFLDVDSHIAGDVRQVTRDALSEARAVVVLIGTHFGERVRSKRDWVAMEVALANSMGKPIVPVISSGSDSALDDLPAQLAFLSSRRRIHFDRSRILAITEELRESFGFRPRAAHGPSVGFQLLLVVLSISLGVLLYRNIALQSELSAEQRRREDFEGRERVATEKLEALQREYHEHLRADADSMRK